MQEIIRKYYSEGLSGDEISNLPQSVYTKLIIFKSLRSYVLCGLLAAVLYFLLWNYSLFGMSLRWIGIIFFGACAVKSALLWLFGLVMFLGNPFFDKKDPFMGTVWKGAELVVVSADLLFFGFLALVFARENISIIKTWGI